MNIRTNAAVSTVEDLQVGEVKIETLRGLCLADKVKWTIHALKRIRERKVLSEAIINTVLSGEIIEQYKDDKPFPSCLVFNSDNSAPIHAVVSSDNETVYIITAYIPSLDDWEYDYKTRKERD